MNWREPESWIFPAVAIWRQESGRWGGQLEDFVAGQKLLELAQSTSPQMRTQLQQLDRTLESVLPTRQTVSSNLDSALLIGHDISTAPRFEGRIDLQFDIGQKPGQQIPVFRLLVDLKDGQLSVPGLPVRLTDVKAVFFTNNEIVELRVDQAQYEDSKLSGAVQDEYGTRGGCAWWLVSACQFPGRDTFAANVSPVCAAIV